MDLQTLISKQALDKEGNQLGEIIRIDRLPQIFHKKIVPHIIIERKIGFRKYVAIPVEASLVIRVENEKVWVKTTIDWFKNEVDRKILQKETNTYKGFINVQSKWFESAVADRRPVKKKRRKK